MRVLFRKDRIGKFKGTVTAVFIDEQFTPLRPANRVCYVHMGQHGECSPDWIRGFTIPARPKEYRALLNELKSIGYIDLKVLQRLPKNWRAVCGT